MITHRVLYYNPYLFWLIDYCLTSSERAALQLSTGRETTRHVYENEAKMRDEWENKATIDSIESGIGINNLAFCSGHNAPSHLQNLRNRLLTWRDHGQANRNITYASTRGFLLSTTMDTLDSSVCLNTGNFHQYKGILLQQRFAGFP